MLRQGHRSHRHRGHEAATAAPRRIAGTPTYGYAATREAAMAAFVKSWRRGKDREVRFRGEADMRCRIVSITLPLLTQSGHRPD
jgi:hypothetical protein